MNNSLPIMLLDAATEEVRAKNYFRADVCIRKHDWGFTLWVEAWTSGCVERMQFSHAINTAVSAYSDNTRYVRDVLDQMFKEFAKSQEAGR